MKKNLILLAALLLVPIAARADFYLTVGSSAAVNIVPPYSGSQWVACAENSASPTAIFTFTNAASSAANTTISTAGNAYTFFAPVGSPFQSGQIIGTIKASSGGPYSVQCRTAAYPGENIFTAGNGFGTGFNASGGGTPGGSPGAIQGNIASAFAAVPGFTFNTTTGALTAQPASDAVALKVLPFNSSSVQDPFEVFNASGTKSVWVDASGNLNFTGNSATYGATSQTTASNLNLIGGSVSNAGPYLHGTDSTGGVANTYLYFDPTASGTASLETSAPTGASTAADVIATAGKFQPQFQPYTTAFPSTSLLNECTVTPAGQFTSASACVAAVSNASPSVLWIHERNCSDDITTDLFANAGKPYVWMDQSFCGSNSNITIEVAQHINGGQFWTCGTPGAAGASPCYVKIGSSFPAFVTSPSSPLTIGTAASSLGGCTAVGYDGSLSGDYVSGGITYVNANGSTDEPDASVGVTSVALNTSTAGCATLTTPSSLPAGVTSFNVYFGYNSSSSAVPHGQTFWTYNTTATSHTFYFGSTTQSGFTTGVPPPEENETAAMFMLGPVYAKNNTNIQIGNYISNLTIDCASTTGTIGVVMETGQEHSYASDLNIDNCEGAAGLLLDNTNGILGPVSSYVNDILIGNTSGVNVSTTKAGIECASCREIHASGRIDVATFDNNSAAVPAGWSAGLFTGPLNTVTSGGVAFPSDSTIFLASFHDEATGSAKFACITEQRMSISVTSLTCVAPPPTGSANVLLDATSDIDISSAWFSPNVCGLMDTQCEIPASGVSGVLEHIAHATFGQQYSNSYPGFDPTLVQFDEEFLGASSSSGTIGALGWASICLVATGCSGSPSTGIIPNVGIVLEQSANTINYGGALTLSTTGGVSVLGLLGTTTSNWDSYFIFEAQNTANEAIRVGYVPGPASNAAVVPAAGGFYLRADAATDTNFQLCNNDGGTEACSDTGQARDSLWHRLRIYNVTTGEIAMQLYSATGVAQGSTVTICAAAVGTCTIVVTAGHAPGSNGVTANKFSPAFEVASEAASSEVIEADAWKFRMWGLHR